VNDTSPAHGRAGKTPKAERTRRQIIAAARQVFERDGYIDARIADIARAAKVAHGTFYTYFTTKEEVFREVANAVVDELYDHTLSHHTGTSIERVRQSNEQFVVVFRDNAEFIRVIEQVAAMNHEFETMRRALRSRAAARVESAIVRYVTEGRADPAIDPRVASHALIGMVYYFCYAWLTLGEPFDDNAAVETLTMLWVKALGLDSAPPS
jgi:AcrR family transcriptional regulator